MRIPRAGIKLSAQAALEIRGAAVLIGAWAMTDTAYPGDVDRLRQVVFDAAIRELAGKKVSHFTLAGVAERAGIPVQHVMDVWPNTPDLMAAALRAYAERNLPILDTGTLRGDLLAYARSCAKTVNTADGRRVLDSLIVRPTDWEMPGPRATFLEARNSRIGIIIARAVARGDCPPDIDAVRFIDQLSIGLCLPVLWYDRDVTDEDCVYVVDLLLNGILPH